MTSQDEMLDELAERMQLEAGRICNAQARFPRQRDGGAGQVSDQILWAGDTFKTSFENRNE